MEKDKSVIERIKKLMDKADSSKEIGSLAEAEAFASKVQELLLQHNLDVADVIKASTGSKKDFKNWLYSEEISYRDNPVGSKLKRMLMGVITSYNLCSYTYNVRKETMRVYGNEENVNLCIFLFNFLHINLVRLREEHVTERGHKKSPEPIRYRIRKSFMIGALTGLDAKFKSLVKEHTMSDQINSLMIVNKDALKEFIKIQDVTLKKSSSRPITLYDGKAYASGVDAGKNAHLGKSLSSSAATTVESKLLR